MSSNIDLCKKLLNNFKSKSPQKRGMDFDDLSSHQKKSYRHQQNSRSRNDDFIEDDEQEIKNKPDSVVIGTSAQGNIAFKTALDPYSNINYFPDVRTLIVGIPGSGKSYLTRAIIEKFYEANPGIIIIVDPENEYLSLREMIPFITFGKNEDCDLTFDENSIADIADKIVELKANTILNLQEFDEDERCNILSNLIQKLLNLPKPKQYPIILFIEEVHLFAMRSNQSSKANEVSKNNIKLLNNIGRKRGISTVLICQRVTQLNAEIVSSCNSYLIGLTINIPDIKRNGELLGLKGKAASTIFKNLNYSFLSYGTVFDHSNLGRHIKFRSLKPETKHLTVADRRFYKFPEPFPATVKVIEQISGKTYKNPIIQTLTPTQQKPFENSSTTKKLHQLKSESPISKYEAIIQTFKKISIKDLFVLSLQKNYSEVSAAFEIQLLLKQEWKNKYDLVEGVIYYLDEDAEKEARGKLPNHIAPLLSSHEYIELWKTELNDYMFDKLIDYLFEDENCNNEFHHIEKFTGLNKQQVSELCAKYSTLNLISKDSECVYLNAIFFAKQIHESLPANFQESENSDSEDFGKFIDNELASKHKEDENKAKSLEKSKDSGPEDSDEFEFSDEDWDEDDDE